MGYVIAGYLTTFLGLGAYAGLLGRRIRKASVAARPPRSVSR